jgi:hypothetical protein
MADATSDPRRRSALIGVLLTIGLLLPGLFLPVITVRGMLQPGGLADLAPQLIDQGISDESIQMIRPMLNPALLPMLELGQGGLRGAVIGPISAQVSAQLRSGPEIEVYNQTRSIIGSVRQLYDVGSYTAATLILLFSVIVPVTKMLLVAWAVSISGPMRRRTLKLVETIAKWSMADVFAVALFIVFLAAQASQQPPGAPESAPPLLAFTAHFGPGFYWFAAYCLFSLASQQYTARLARQGVTS